MNLLLASVSDVFEAETAAEHGADWIDIKDPLSGALGAPARHHIDAVVSKYAGRFPLSATLGDDWETSALLPAKVAELAGSGLDYAKVALKADQVSDATLDDLYAATVHGLPLIVVCMAENPPDVLALERLLSVPIAGAMLDTADKQQGSLMDLLEAASLRAFVEQVQAAGRLCGLAGRLREADIDRLVPAGANYLGFRSALCEDGNRRARLSADKVGRVAQRLRCAQESFQPVSNAG